MVFWKSIICASSVLFIVGCDIDRSALTGVKGSTENPSPSRFEVEIIPYSDIPLDWDSTFFQHDATWNIGFDTLAADSLAREFLVNKIKIQDMWYPHSVFMCGIPTKAGSEVIIRLNSVDDNLSRLGFEKATSFPLVCCQKWKHYRFIE